MKVPIPLINLLGYFNAFNTALDKSSKKELKWGNSRKTFLLSVIALLSVYVGLSNSSDYEDRISLIDTDKRNYQLEISRLEISVNHYSKVLDEAKNTIELQKQYIEELQKEILTLKADNKDLALEINSMDRLLAASVAKQREAEARLTETLQQLKQISRVENSELENLQRRFNTFR